MASGESLADFYNLNHIIVNKYNYTLTELEEMLPYEREIYVALLEKDIKEQKQKAQNNVSRYR